jgi:hypothetical protein
MGNSGWKFFENRPLEKKSRKLKNQFCIAHFARRSAFFRILFQNGFF